MSSLGQTSLRLDEAADRLRVFAYVVENSRAFMGVAEDVIRPLADVLTLLDARLTEEVGEADAARFGLLYTETLATIGIMDAAIERRGSFKQIADIAAILVGYEIDAETVKSLRVRIRPSVFSALIRLLDRKDGLRGSLVAARQLDAARRIQREGMGRPSWTSADVREELRAFEMALLGQSRFDRPRAAPRPVPSSQEEESPLTLVLALAAAAGLALLLLGRFLRPRDRT